MSITLKGSRRRKTTWAAVVTALAVLAAPLVATAPAVATGPSEDKKVWVCKIVRSDNAPGGYALKEGKQPIHVSINALDADVNPVPGAPFSDAQPSFVVAEDNVQLCLDGLPKGDASASVSTVPATCELGEKLVNGAISNASFSGTPDGTYGPGEYSVTATADPGFEFSPGVTTLEFSGPLAGPLDPSNPSCAPPPPQTVTASVSTTPPSCEVGETLVITTSENVTLTGTANGTQGPGSYMVTATAAPGYEFSPGVTVLEFSGTLAGPLESSDCEEPVLEFEAGDFGDCIERVEGGFVGGAFAENSENSTESLTFNLKVTDENLNVVYDESVEVAPGERADLGHTVSEDTGVYTFTYYVNGEEVGAFNADSDCQPNEEEPGAGIVDVIVVSECKTRINQETGLVESYILVTTTLENLRVESDEPVRPTTFNYGAPDTELTEVTVGDDEILVVTEEFPAGYAGGEFDYLVGIKDGLGEFQYGEYTVNTEPCHDTEEPGDPTGDASVTCLTGGDVRIDWTGENPSDAEGNAVYDLIAFPLYESEQVVEPGGVLDAEIIVSPTEVDYVELYLYGELLERIEVGDEFCGTEEPEEGEFVITTTSKCLTSGDTEVTVTGTNTTDSVQTVRVGIEEDDTFLLEFDVPAGATVSETFVLKHGFGNGTATIYAGDANAPVAPQPVEIDTDNCPKPPVIPENPEKPEQPKPDKPKPPVLATTGASDLSGAALLAAFGLLGGLGLLAARRLSARA